MFTTFLVVGSLLLVALGWGAYEVAIAPTLDEDGNPVPGPGLQAIDFPERNVEIAKDQPQYRTLPAFVDTNTAEGVMVTCWQLSWRDRLAVLVTGKLWASVWTFSQPLQPLYFSPHKHDVLRTVRTDTDAIA